MSLEDYPGQCGEPDQQAQAMLATGKITYHIETIQIITLPLRGHRRHKEFRHIVKVFDVMHSDLPFLEVFEFNSEDKRPLPDLIKSMICTLWEERNTNG
jgi:hypothetical protein